MPTQPTRAKAYRQKGRGEEPLDVEHELRSLMKPAPTPGADPELLQEIRQLVIARNERGARRGEEPLDVEAEVARELRDLEGPVGYGPSYHRPTSSGGWTVAQVGLPAGYSGSVAVIFSSTSMSG